MTSRGQVEAELADAVREGHIPEGKADYVSRQVQEMLESGGEFGPRFARAYLRRCIRSPQRIGREEDERRRERPRPRQQELSGDEEFLPPTGHPAQPKGDT